MLSSLLVCHVLSEVNQGIGSIPKQRGVHMGMTTRWRGFWGHLRGCLPPQQTYSRLSVGGNKVDQKWPRRPVGAPER